MDQKKLTILTLVVVLVGAVSINEFIIKNSLKEQDREVASFGERFEPEQIKWEQELAKTIANQADAKTKIGSKPNGQDRLMYEVLGGHYSAQVMDGKNLKISLIPNQTPLDISTDELIRNYSDLVRGAVKSTSIKTGEHTESISLQGRDGAPVGTLTVERDEQGLVHEINFN